MCGSFDTNVAHAIQKAFSLLYKSQIKRNQVQTSRETLAMIVFAGSGLQGTLYI